jgi:hypothetical protein
LASSFASRFFIQFGGLVRNRCWPFNTTVLPEISEANPLLTRKKATQQYPDEYSGTKIPRLSVLVENGSQPESANAKTTGNSQTNKLKRRK